LKIKEKEVERETGGRFHAGAELRDEIDTPNTEQVLTASRLPSGMSQRKEGKGLGREKVALDREINNKVRRGKRKRRREGMILDLSRGGEGVGFPHGPMICAPACNRSFAVCWGSRHRSGPEVKLKKKDLLGMTGSWTICR